LAAPSGKPPFDDALSYSQPCPSPYPSSWIFTEYGTSLGILVSYADFVDHLTDSWSFEDAAQGIARSTFSIVQSPPARASACNTRHCTVQFSNSGAWDCSPLTLPLTQSLNGIFQLVAFLRTHYRAFPFATHLHTPLQELDVVLCLWWGKLDSPSEAFQWLQDGIQ
jgi:hypothetical protein